MQIYETVAHPWGAEPIAFIKEHVSLFKPGSVLDLGGGDGRNALYLAQQGFFVTNIDMSARALEECLKSAKELGVSEQIQVIQSDLKKLVLEQTYDNVICNMVLHFLPEESFYTLIEQMQKQTSSQGLNVVSDFTREGPMYSASHGNYWLKAGELCSLYKEWDILSYSEAEGKARQLDEHGNHYIQMRASLVARKT